MRRPFYFAAKVGDAANRAYRRKERTRGPPKTFGKGEAADNEACRKNNMNTHHREETLLKELERRVALDGEHDADEMYVRSALLDFLIMKMTMRDMFGLDLRLFDTRVAAHTKAVLRIGERRGADRRAAGS
jgi:hypothetical protein